MEINFSVQFSVLYLFVHVDGRPNKITYFRSHLDICLTGIPGQDSFEEALWYELKGADRVVLDVVYRLSNSSYYQRTRGDLR